MTPEGERRIAPWEARLYGVVSLFDMLEFSAEDFLEITHKLGLNSWTNAICTSQRGRCNRESLRRSS